ncbi:hypothetical protein FALBO_8956 [Fusarium albosuccineum]|uniref:NACHT-NTPase and P-loop NTPases N-terminal domain-containing protein n=1 Tax=Fusarium albosuccineum TaxID=1237068 RepID=A0A8H4PJ91_9HYPO|nr:hypothetical protein FALBO_8956 [Fusarium albosuccineum]
MAEILGIVSSVITIVEVAGKLGASTIKLKRLWGEVQDVPTSIRRCIEELELLAPAIEEMDIEFQRTRDMVQHDSAARRSVEYSRKAIRTLETLVKDMEGQIASERKSKKLLAQFNVRLKRNVIEEHHHRLQFALQLVNLSQQTYLIALTRAQPSIIMSELQVMRENELADAPRAALGDQDCPSSESEATQVLTAGTSQHSQALSNSRSGRSWWPTVKSIPWKPTGLLVGFTHQVEELAIEEQSDLDLGPTKVHQARLQLPYWMTQKAWDLQAYRAYDGWKFHFNSWSTRPRYSDVFRWGDADRVGGFIWDRSRSDITEAAEVVQIREADAGLTFSFGAMDLQEQELSSLFCGTPESKVVLSLPSNVIRMLEIYWPPADPALLLQLLEKGNTLPSLFRFGKHASWGLYGFAWQYFHALLNDWQAEKNLWRRLARLMLVGVESRDIAVPWVDAHDLPLLSSLLAETWRRQFPLRAFDRWVSKAVSMWLEDLYEAGVDLEGYMLCEMSVSRVEGDGASMTILQPGARLRDSGPSLVIIEHGKHPEDWVVEWDPCIEELSGEFWSVITAPPALPGAWIDDAEDDGIGWCHMRDYGVCVLALERWRGKDPGAQPSRMRGIPRCREGVSLSV